MDMEKNSEGYVNTEIWDTDERNDLATRRITINAMCQRKERSWQAGGSGMLHGEERT